MHQTGYVRKLAARFKVDETSPAPQTPFPMNADVGVGQARDVPAEEEISTSDTTLYRGIVGALQYLTHTASMLGFACSRLGTAQSQSTLRDLHLAKRTLRFAVE